MGPSAEVIGEGSHPSHQHHRPGVVTGGWGRDVEHSQLEFQAMILPKMSPNQPHIAPPRPTPTPYCPQTNTNPTAEHSPAHNEDPNKRGAPKPTGTPWPAAATQGTLRTPSRAPQAQSHPRTSPGTPPYLPRAVPRGKLPAPSGRCWCLGCGRAVAGPRGWRHAGTAPACTAGGARWLGPPASSSCPVLAPAALAGGATEGAGWQPGRAAQRGGGGGGGWW